MLVLDTDHVSALGFPSETSLELLERIRASGQDAATTIVTVEEQLRGWLAEISERLADFFASGTQMAWIIHPEEQFLEICHSPVQRKILGSGAVLDGEQLLPGFQSPIADLFKEWDWD